MNAGATARPDGNRAGPRHEELWSLTPGGRRIVVDVLMRRRGQTGRPRSVRLSNVCLKRAPRQAFR
jgi:hypothetical protein